MIFRNSLRVVLLACAAALYACDELPGEIAEEAKAAEPPGLLAGIVDSILPIEEEMRRFRESVEHAPTTVSGAATSRDELIERFVRDLEEGDTAGLAAAHLDRAEFIYLYFPHTVYMEAPYQMDPALIWFQMMNNSSRGMTRAYRRFEGESLNYEGHRCEEEIQEGPNRLWDGCVVELSLNGAERTELRLFGLILERSGIYKFVTYGNDL